MISEIKKIARLRPEVAAARVYDKGERRFKHVGTTAEPEIEFHSDNPKHWVGKCPNNISDADKNQLLNEAIAEENGDREIDFPKKLYVVDRGAIYRAQTTDRGRSYHGYPYRGKLGRRLIQELEKIAIRKHCEDGFKQWVKKYIEFNG